MRKKRSPAFAIAVVTLFTALSWAVPLSMGGSELLQRWKLQTRDLFFKIRHMSVGAPETTSDLLVVSIDEESCQQLEARWPWSRRLIAQLIEELDRGGVKAIALNLSFTGLESGDPEANDALALAMQKHGNVIIGATFDRENNVVKPTPILAEAARRYGYLEKIIDEDLTIRRSYLVRPYSLKRRSSYSSQSAVLRSDTYIDRSFPAQAVAAEAGTGAEGEAQYNSDLRLVTLGVPNRGVYVEEDGSYTINYLVGAEDLAEVPAWKIVQGKIARAHLEGKIALVGLTSALFLDTHPTPLGNMPGVIIHANELIAIRDGRMLAMVPDVFTAGLSWAIGLCVIALFMMRRFWLGIVGFVVAFLGSFLGAEVAFFSDRVMEPLILLAGSLISLVVGILANLLRLLLENKGLETTVIHDKMTGLYKYEYLRECLDEEWRRCKRAMFPVSVVMTDLDRFKRINDTLGHEVGNQMIVRAGEVIRDSARRYDIVSRYGGDEFVILLWHASLEEAKAYRKRLRDMYHAMAAKLDDPMLKDSSISIGVATFDPKQDPNHPKDPQELVEIADKDLFEDKESRRKPGEPRR
ncbi:MAG: hypothetical protein MOGMAGMI_00784 [Candidatus Omnitrophica bacterium]|nr:hypothetical protein [Candidatus Omnitrophota bacterium]